MTTTAFSPAAYLKSEEAQAAYLTAAIETADIAFILDAIGVVAEAKGMSDDIASAGLSNAKIGTEPPSLADLVRLLDALGLRLTVSPAAA